VSKLLKLSTPTAGGSGQRRRARERVWVVRGPF